MESAILDKDVFTPTQRGWRPHQR